MRRLLVLCLLCSLALTATASAQPVEPRIIGGTAVGDGEYPWQVAMLLTNGTQYCGGTLVARQWVLTADHCGPLTTESVRVQSIFRDEGGHVVGIESVVPHPLNAGGLRYDVSLVELEVPVDGARPLHVASDNEAGSWADGAQLTITGWGRTVASPSNEGSRVMLQATVPRVADATCEAVYTVDFFADDMFCAGFEAGGVDTCQGDSGGPIIAPVVSSPSKKNPAHWRLVGATSWGEGCAQAGFPGVYARVAAPAIREWVTSTIPPEPLIDTTDIDAQASNVPVSQEPADTPPPPVEVAEPPPVVVPPPPAAPRPVELAVRRRCTRARRCTFTITPDGAVARLRATLSTTVRRPCVRRGRPATCRRTRRTALRARPVAGGFTVATPRLRKGSHRLTLTPYDAAGARLAAATRYRFTVR